MKRLLQAAVLLLPGLALCSGCAAVSLFSSEHTHYHGTKELDARITSLENRVTALETGSACGANQPPVAPPVQTYPPAR